MDETYVRVKGKWRYLYRAVDSTGATLDFLLSAKQDAAAAKRFLVKALGRANHPTPIVRWQFNGHLPDIGVAPGQNFYRSGALGIFVGITPKKVKL
jgi:DDE domain